MTTAATSGRVLIKSPLFHFLQSNGINSLAELHQKITAMQSDYYALRGEIVSAEREIAPSPSILKSGRNMGRISTRKRTVKKSCLKVLQSI